MNDQVAVMLIGHGSARHPDSAAPMRALAAELSRKGPWPETHAAFMRQAPHPSEMLESLTASIVVVVPVFTGKGHYTDRLVPAEMGLDGPITRRDGRVILYTAPVGCHPLIPGLMACRADGIVRDEGCDPRSASLVLVAHGSAKPGGSGETSKAIAAKIAAANYFAEVALLFLEQEPFAAHWPDLVSGKDLVVLPLLVAQGLHASQDIPPLFGFVPGQTGSTEHQGRRIRLAAGLGAEPELVDIIVELVENALTTFRAE